MIFVTIGTHYMEFPRLLKQIDAIAPKIGEKIIVQRGYTRYVPKNCESFAFASSLAPYYKKARLIILHGASSVWEVMYQYEKPMIIVPRQARFKEHINDHQVEFAEAMHQKVGMKVIYKMSELTPELLRKKGKKIRVKKDNLYKLQEFIKRIVDEVETKRIKS